MRMSKKVQTSGSTGSRRLSNARFVSLRWRFTSPLFLIVLIVAMIGAYVLAQTLGTGLAAAQNNILLQSSAALSRRSAVLYEHYVGEATSIAYTSGIDQSIRAEDTPALAALLESRARLAGLDSIIVTNTLGIETAGVLRVVDADGSVRFALNTGTNLRAEAPLRAILGEGAPVSAGLLLSNEGVLLVTAVPIVRNNAVVGVVLVGSRMQTVLADLQGSSVAEVALYASSGTPLGSSLPLSSDLLDTLTLAPEIYDQAIATGATSGTQRPVQSLTLANSSYDAVYTPFQFGPALLGVVATLVPNDVPFATELGRQLVALFAAVLAGVVVFAGFITSSIVTARANRVRQTAELLAAGQREARTGMQRRDELGAAGQALDVYAETVQEREDVLRSALRRQRREASYLVAVLESIPEGIVVQDVEGRIMLMNDAAKVLLGSQRVFRSAGIHELAAVVAEKLGAALAPGLYALGDPQRIRLEERLLSAQAAAIVSPQSEQRVGTVIVLRDITGAVVREKAQERLLEQFVREVQEPLIDLARSSARQGTQTSPELMRVFTRDIARNVIALQKLIVEMRELTTTDLPMAQRAQKPLRLDTLVWAIANEWRQVAQSSGITLHVLIEQKGLHILGDERRLRWAIGNIVDNAIKYTLPGGAMTLEIKTAENDTARLRIRDNGVGIAEADLPHVFKRFFRGEPAAPDGHIIRVPGMGQGLSVARQILEAHGGSIRVKSAQGVGTAVYFTLPLTSTESLPLPIYSELDDLEGETVMLPTQFEERLRGL